METQGLRLWLYIAMCVFAAAGCADSPQPVPATNLPHSEATNHVTSKVSHPELRPPNDESLMLDEYIEGGMPTHDRLWNGEDMARAAKLLEEMVLRDAGELPRYQSQRSGEAFNRFTDDENLELYLDRSLPLQQRLPDALNYMQSSNQILKAYLAAFNEHAVGDSELVELMGAQLRTLVVMCSLVNEFLPTLDKDDPTYPVRLDGLKKMKSGMATVVAGNLQTLTESQAYRSSELKRLIGYMEATLPNILPDLPDGSRAETLIRLRSFLDDPTMQDLKPELDALVSAMETTDQPDDAP